MTHLKLTEFIRPKAERGSHHSPTFPTMNVPHTAGVTLDDFPLRLEL